MNVVVKNVEMYVKFFVDYYVKMDQQLVVDVVNKLGGIIVINKCVFEYSNIVFLKGLICFIGKEVFVYLKECNE